jgi:predicted esterase
MKKTTLLLLALLWVLINSKSQAQNSVMNVNDTIVEYDELNPPPTPNWGVLSKWVRTVRVNWNTDSYKCYFYKGMPFRLKFPLNYDTTGNTQYPMIVMFHGKGNYAVSLYDNEKPLHTGGDGGKFYRDAVDNGSFDGFIMFPQNTNGFFNSAHYATLDDLFNNYFPDIHVDINRISLTGSSAGAYSTWNAGLQFPMNYAAIVPMSGVSTNNIPDLANLRQVRMWLFQGELDKSPTPYTANLVKDAADNLGMDFTYTEYKGSGHGIWGKAYREPELIPYFIKANKTNPVVYYGKSEFCPGDTILATLGVTAGFDSYEWRKNGVVIAGANSNELTVSQLGIYDVRIQRDTTWSYWSVTPVVIKMKDATITPPIEVLGLATHVLPAPDSLNQLTLSLPVAFEEYAWKLDGQAMVLGTDATFVTSTPGDYVVAVTEKFGCESSDSQVFNVLDANAANGPQAPSNAKVFAVSKTALKVVWVDHPSSTYNETAYEIYRTTTSGTAYQYIGTAPQDAVEYLDENLISNQTYYYVIRAINENAAAPSTAEVAGTTQSDHTAPSAPGNLTLVNTSTNSISVRWNTSSDDVGIEKYEVYVGGINSVVTADTTATIYNLSPYQTYNVTVKARDFAGNYSPSSTPLTTTTVFRGLDYKYYEGVWTVLPDFNALTPVDSGHVDNIDISLKQVTDDYAFLWEGKIHIPVAGNYTFETRSDDGSKVYIGGYDTGTVVVDNDGRHSARYRSGTYNFPVAGVYPIAVSFFRNGNSETMLLYWKNTAHGIGSGRELIPNSAFVDETPLPGNPPASPGNLSAVAVSHDQINLSWADSSNNETGFQLLRRSGSGNYVPIALVGANVTAYSDTNLSAATTYAYQITAVGKYGISASGADDAVFSLNFNNNIDDQSGNLLSSLENGATYVTENIEGSHALLLDGVNDYVKLGPGNGYFHNTFSHKTVAMWAKIENHNGARILFEEGGTGQGIAIRTNNGTLQAAVRQSSSQTTISAPFTDTNWVHIALVFDAGNLSLYVNGVSIANNPSLGYTQVTGHSNGCGLGGTNGNNAFGSNGNETQGRIDDFVVLETALNAAGITALMAKNGIYANATTLPLPAVPTAPDSLTLTALSPTAIELNWNDNSNNEDEFVLYRSVGTNSNFLPLITLAGDTGTGSETHVDSGLFANSTYYYLITASNAGGEDSSGQANSTTLNNVPELDEVPAVQVRYNTTENVQLYATDMDGDAISLSASNLPLFATLTDYTDGSGLLSLSPQIADTNTYPDVVITATDAFGGTASDTFTITVMANFLPALLPIANVTMDEGDSLSVLVTATDSNGVASLAWGSTGLPAFVTLSGNNDGTAWLTFQPGFADGGTYTGMEVTVDDQNGGTGNAHFNMTINEVNPNNYIKVNFQHSVAAASPWNNVNSVNPVALYNEQGQPTPYGVDLVGTVWNSYNEGTTTGTNSGVVPDDVLKEYYYFGIFGAPNTVDFNITGLSTGSAYNLSILASSKWNGTPNNGTTKFAVNGQTDSLYAHYNTANTVDFNLVSPDTNGNLLVSMSKASGTTVGYINAFVLEEVYNYGQVPAAARNLSANFGGGGVQLQWYDAPYNETEYNVFRSETAGGSYTQINAQALSANTFQYTDNNVSENETFYYKVQASNGFGTAAFSNIASAYVPNTAPALSIAGDTLLEVDSTMVLHLTTSDSPLNTVALTATNLPAFATLVDSTNGNGSIQLLPGFNDVGQHVFSVTATDNLGAFETQEVSVTVNDQKLYSVHLNFSNTSNAAAPWNNTAKSPQLNDTFSNLIDDNSQATDIDVTLTSAFGGFYNEGAQTGDNSGVVPDNVLKEYYWFGIFGAPNQAQLKVSGLDSQKKYNFRFVGSSVFHGSGISDNGETDFTINSQTVPVDVEGNTSEVALFEGVIADNNGEVIIDITKGNGASVGYLNAMIIDVYAADTTRFDPSDLSATASSSTAIDLTWKDNALDETGFEIQRSTTGLEMDFVSIDTVPANVITYTDNGLSNNHVYHYRVRANRGVSNTGFTNAAQSGTIAFKVYVNINGSSAFDAPAPWNNLSIAASNGNTFSGFHNDLGNPSGMNMTWNTAMDGSNEWGTSTGNNSGIYPDTVMRSFYYNDAFGEAADITMNGLSQAYTYNFHFFGAIVTGFDINTNFTIGTTTVTNAQTDNTSEVASIKGITPNSNNEIDILVQEAAGSNWAIFNAMVIEAVTAAPLSSKTKPTAEVPGSISVHHGVAQPEIGVYPNPFGGEVLNISYSDASLGSTTISVTDLTGRTVLRTERENETHNGLFVINLRNTTLNNGVYIIQAVFADGKTSTARLVNAASDQ